MRTSRNAARYLPGGRLLLLLSLLLAVAGAKLQLIDRYGSDLPYWDQWDAEGDFLLRPYLEGRFTAHELVQPHNEHRPVFTRLWSLALFEAGEAQWDARVQLVFNIALHAALAGLLVALAWRALPPLAAGGFGVLTALFVSTSVSWENTLSGFQSQFYFTLLFCGLHLGGTLLAPVRSWRWWLAMLAGAAALLSMASGLLSAAAIIAATSLRALRDRRLTRDALLLLGLNAILVVTGLLLQSTVPGHDALKASSPAVWLDAFLHQFSWPMISLWAAPIGLLPPVAIAVAYLRRRIDGPVALTLLGASAWFCLQAAAIAYARGGELHGYSSRYCDTLSVGVLINALSLGYLASTAGPRRFTLGWAAGTAGFVLIVVGGLVRESAATYETTLRILPDINNARIASVRRYVESRDPAFFQKLPWDELPYPSAERLANLLEAPALRAVLPASVRPAVSLAADPDATRGFRSGVPDSDVLATVPRELAAWTSVPGGNSRFASTRFVTNYSRLTLFVAREGRGTSQLWLVDADNRRHQPLGPLAEGPSWRRVNFSVPPGEYRLVAEHDGPGWLGFTAPVEMSALSSFAVKISRVGPWCLGTAAVLALAALVRLWPRFEWQPAVPRLPADFEFDMRATSRLTAAEAVAPVSDRRSPVEDWRYGLGPAPKGRECQDSVAPAAGCPQPTARRTQYLFRAIWLLGGGALLLPWLRPLVPADAIQLPAAAQAVWVEGGFQPGGQYPGTLASGLPVQVRAVGSWVQGDGWRGEAVTKWLPALEPALMVAVAGYPRQPDCSLAVEFRDADETITRKTCDMPNPGETWSRWRIVAPEGTKEIRLTASDQASAHAGWFAFSEPFAHAPNWPAGWFMLVQTGATVALALSLVWIPGLLLGLARLAPELRVVVKLAAGPGILIGMGLLTWWLGGALSPDKLGSGLVSVAWVAIGLQLWSHPPALRPGEARVFAIAALVVTAAAAKAGYSGGPEGELYGGTISRTLAVGDRSDARISFHIVQTAAHHFSPVSVEAEGYFSPWSFFTRGPLAGLAATPVALATAGRPPVGMPDDPWRPFDVTGFAAYRILMMALAGLVILALFDVLLPFAGERWALIAAGLLALTPFGLHEILFTWPKWVATAWTLIAFLLVHRGRPGLAGCALGVGFLHHPLALLWAPWLALWAAGRTGFRLQAVAVIGLRFTAGLFLLVLPWMIAGGLAPHSEAATGAGQVGFIKYFQMADGGPATWATWWHSRGKNLANTFLPFWLHLFHQDNPAVSSVYGPSPPIVRFAFGWWATLPLGLGLVLYAISLVALLRAGRSLLPALALLVVGPALLLTAYWGAFSTGLLRECGHPLFAAWIALTCVSLARNGGLAAKLVALPLFPWLQLPEVFLMLWLTTLLNPVPPGVASAVLDPVYLAVNVLSLLGVAWLLAWSRRSAARKTSPGVTQFAVASEI